MDQALTKPTIWLLMRVNRMTQEEKEDGVEKRTRYASMVREKERERQTSGERKGPHAGERIIIAFMKNVSTIRRGDESKSIGLVPCFHHSRSFSLVLSSSLSLYLSLSSNPFSSFLSPVSSSLFVDVQKFYCRIVPRAKSIASPNVPHFADSLCKLQVHASRIKLIAIYCYAPSTLLRHIKVRGGETRRSMMLFLTLQRCHESDRGLIFFILKWKFGSRTIFREISACHFFLE